MSASPDAPPLPVPDAICFLRPDAIVTTLLYSYAASFASCYYLLNAMPAVSKKSNILSIRGICVRHSV
jgi:hypothetical protein